jgi:hypothetical protein
MPSRPETPAGDLDEVVHRLRTDAGFKAAVVRDPRRVLAAYDLDADDLRRLTQLLADDHGSLDPVEQRTAKAGLFALLSGALTRRGVGRREILVPDVIGFQQPGSTPPSGPASPARADSADVTESAGSTSASDATESAGSTSAIDATESAGRSAEVEPTRSAAARRGPCPAGP